MPAVPVLALAIQNCLFTMHVITQIRLADMEYILLYSNLNPDTRTGESYLCI